MDTADYFISKLDMQPHPEGGYYKEVYRSNYNVDGESLPYNFNESRDLFSTIYFLLKPGQISKFHKLRSDEVWFYHYGSPVNLHIIDEHGRYTRHRLGTDIESGEQPQLLVPANTVFAAKPDDPQGFSLVSNMVSPGFEFRDFVLYSREKVSEMFPHLSDTIKDILEPERQ